MIGMNIREGVGLAIVGVLAVRILLFNLGWQFGLLSLFSKMRYGQRIRGVS